ncbi:MAG: F0F1 ATP synthase subunit alpha [Clostridia bacterium]|jgi:F-type H+-transporting ATPase subunit alpha
MDIKAESISRTIHDKIAEYQEQLNVQSIGTVIQAGDGIARIQGLQACKYGELLKFGENSFGVALNLEKDMVGAVLLNNESKVSEGMTVHSTGNIIQVPVGEALIGRVVNPLGYPIDGKGKIRTSRYRPIEAEAPSILDRQLVSEPLQTGIMAIDAMIPIGKGQRELIIGDRQTGKTAIAVDTILNQKNKHVIFIYVSIGQKASTISQIKTIFEETGAMDYTIMVTSSAGNSAPMQYIAPYAGCAMAEEFMYRGKDVLIVYDDLSKHAIAYRTMSLLLRRPPGREAYPGDVFYLHSRLLERAAKLKDELGGGSITALPITETMAGDISAYIPTNVISITDGQIFLESELFFAGLRPAINVGLSVSRVGGTAQIKAMRQVAGPLRLLLAQYRELAIFVQFGSELDKSTQELLAQGERIIEILKQEQYKPLDVENQIILLYVATHKFLMDIPVKEIKTFELQFLSFIDYHYPGIKDLIRETGECNEEVQRLLEKAVAEFKPLLDHDEQ